MVRERLTKEDEENIDIILNPYPLATENTLNEIDASNDPEVRNKLVGDLSVILSNYAAVLNPKVQEKFPKLVSLLRDKEIYNSGAFMLSDACRHIEDVQNAFRALGVFELLDFAIDHYKATISLVYSLCMENKSNTEHFLEKYYNKERDEDNALIQSVRDQSF
ncbi:hypothetical protein KMI_10g16250 [Encephalitozoon hellem]|nr:hypothetical protein KMI_10g16250 [Encephalitozoon hellem]